jgi:hypothetical protein
MTMACGAEFLHSFHCFPPASPALVYYHFFALHPTLTAYIKRPSRPVDDATFYACR